MTVEQEKVVDAIGVETASGLVVLTIADHLTWLDVEAHLTALVAKVNAYLRFLESGEVYQAYPDANDRAFRIDVVFQHAPTQAAEDFLVQARATVERAGFMMSWRVLTSDDSARDGLN